MKTALMPIERDTIRRYPSGDYFYLTQPRTPEQLLKTLDPQGAGITINDVIDAIRDWHGVHCEDGFVCLFDDVHGKKSDGSPFCYGIRFYKINWSEGEIVHVQLVREWGKGAKSVGGKGEFILLPVFEL